MNDENPYKSPQFCEEKNNLHIYFMVFFGGALFFAGIIYLCLAFSLRDHHLPSGVAQSRAFCTMGLMMCVNSLFPFLGAYYESR